MTLVVDVETHKKRTITCIGLSDGPTFAMAIPFVQPNGKGLENFWSVAEESRLFRRLFRLLTHKNTRLVGQNFAYDIFCLRDLMGHTLSTHFNTMLAHHLLFPGTPKTLEYISSLYCKYYWFWKRTRRTGISRPTSNPYSNTTVKIASTLTSVMSNSRGSLTN